MPDKIFHRSGAIEQVETDGEKSLRRKLKNKKRAADLTDDEVREIVFELAKQAKLKL